MQNSKQTLGKIIRHFKARISKLVHDGSNPHFQWQRNYYEHIIRSEEDMHRIRQYIHDNPINWETDEENPHCRSRPPCLLLQIETYSETPIIHPL